MKSRKKLGLIALAMLMTTAISSPGFATAEPTALCSADPGTGAEKVCSKGNLVNHVHEVSVGKAKLLSSIEVQCNVLFLGDTNSSLTAFEGEFTYTNCGCSVEQIGEAAKIEILKEGHETGSVKGTVEVLVECFGIECIYNGTGLKGTAKGPLLSTEANGEIIISEQALNGKGISGEGIFCPSQGKLDLKTTPLIATYITNAAEITSMPESAALCDVDPGTGSAEACPAGHLVTQLHQTSVGKAKLLAEPEVQCNVLFSSTSVGELANPLVIKGHFTYTYCGDNCLVQEKVGTTAEIKVVKKGHERAKFIYGYEVEFSCEGIECVYRSKGFGATAKGPLLAANEHGEVVINSQTLKVVSGSLCPDPAKWDLILTPLVATYVTS